MIDSSTLNKCIDILAELNANTLENKNKMLLLELGYIIKQELDLVEKWENENKNIGRPSIEVKKLIEDNTQLCHENQKLTETISTLKQLIDEEIPKIKKQINTITSKHNVIINTVNALSSAVI